MAEPAPHPVSLEYILGLTAFTAGAVDIFSFTRLGGLFASAMTGNLAFLGLYIARGQALAAIGSFIALAGYVAGTAFGHLMARGRDRHGALTRLLAVEVALLASAAAVWLAAAPGQASPAFAAVIVALAVAMGVQSIVGKQVNLSNIPTVVFTSTLTNIVIGVTEKLARGEGFRLTADTKRQLVSFFLYLFGAFCAGLLAYLRVRWLIGLPLAGALAALASHLAAGAETPTPLSR